MVRKEYGDTMRISPGERIFSIVNVLCLCLLAGVMLIPLLSVFTSSLMPSYIMSQYNNTLLMPIPKHIQWDAYIYIFRGESKLIGAYLSTTYVVLLGTFLSLLVTSMMAYPLSHKELKGWKYIMVFVFVTMLFSGGMIPTYLIVKASGIINTYWAIIIPNIVSAWNLILLRNFFSTIPPSLEESAMVEGAGEVKILFRVILPLSKPALATIGLFYAVWYWNDFYNALLYINDSNKWTLQLFLRQILVDATPSMLNDTSSLDAWMGAPPPVEQVKMATIIAATVPILLVYPFIQKYFVKGIMVGSIKG